MPSTVVASRSHGRGIVMAVGLVLVLVSACGKAGSTTSAPVPDATPSTAIATTVPSTPTVATPRLTASPRPSALVPVALGPRLRATIDGIAQPCAMASMATDVWVTGNGPSTLARIDPETNTIVEKVDMIGSACGIAIGPDGRVWVVDRTNKELLRIDPVTAVVAGRAEIGPGGSGLALTDGAVWVVDDVDGTVSQVDPVSMSVTETARLTRGASWFADDDGTPHGANRLDGSIIVLDPATLAAGAAIFGGKGPLDGTILGGRAYIPDGSTRALLEVDLATGSIAAADTLHGAKDPFVAEVAFGDVWVLDYGGQRIWRIAP